MNKLHVLDLEIKIGDHLETIHPAILEDEHYCVLIDAGFPNYLEQLEEAMRNIGIRPETMTHLIITHHDHDHMGAAAAIKRKYPQVIIMASSEEAPYISGEKKAIRLEQAEKMQAHLPPEQQAFGEAFSAYLKTIEPVAVDQIVKDQDLLPFCDGTSVIGTSGHTPGHIALYIPALSAVVAGDAMVVENGKPAVANPEFAMDLPLAESALQKLLDIKASDYICYHGGIWYYI